MSTYYPTTEQGYKNRKWLLIDASNRTLGRLASEVASLLRGKHKPTFTPHVDCGDFVVVVNAEKIRLSGNKAEGKIYYHHTGYVGGVKAEKAGALRQRNPQRMIELAVDRMLPRGGLGHKMIRKLKVYRGAEHPHKANNPELYTLQNEK